MATLCPHWASSPLPANLLLCKAPEGRPLLASRSQSPPLSCLTAEGSVKHSTVHLAQGLSAALYFTPPGSWSLVPPPPPAPPPHPEHSAPSLLGSVILLCLEPTPPVLALRPSCWSPPDKQLDFLVELWPAYCLLVPSTLPGGGPLHSSSLPSTPFPMIFQPCPRIKNG